jgi:peptidoglycan/LPS O-acetylase OafA/YrhL
MVGGRGSPDDLVAGYRPWLDGLRALAVLLVLVQHTVGAMPVDLGNYGVALFFALSGYLITSLLLDERRATGSVSLRAFYLRRAGRLVPALVLLVVVMDALFVIAGDHGPLRGSLAALFYTANYAEIIDPDFVLGYGPTWSLAVEEHFYLLWPLLLLWMNRRFGLRATLSATLAICVLAIFWRGVLAVLHAPLDMLSIGSLERADALLYGCAAAIAVRLGWRPHAWMLWLGLAGVAVAAVGFTGHPYVSSIFSNAVTAGAGAAIVVCLDYAAVGWIRSLLSLRLLVSVGIISYGLYLWHGPLMRLAGQLGGVGPAWRGVAATVAIVAAALSYHFVEVPVRSWARRRAEELADRRGGGGPPVEQIQERFVLDPASAQPSA